MSKPTVSILMTAYNREAFIDEAIESALAQTFTDFELLIVDDASSDFTLEIAKRYAQRDSRIQVFQNANNLGDYPNRNIAASYAKAKYIKYLDSDDVLKPKALQIMVDAMEKFPEAVMGISPSVTSFDQSKLPLLSHPPQTLFNHYFNGLMLFGGPGSTIIKTQYFQRVGGFSGKRFISDTEFWLQTALRNPLVILPGNLLWWRQHDGQEFRAGQRTKDYCLLEYQLDSAILNDKDCPLDEITRQWAIRNFKNRFSRKVVGELFRFNFSIATAMMKSTGHRWTELPLGYFPYNRWMNLLHISNSNLMKSDYNENSTKILEKQP